MKHSYIILMLILLNLIPLIPIANANNELYMREHFGVVWRFYSDRIEIFDRYSNELLVIDFTADKKLTSSYVYADGNKVYVVMNSSKVNVTHVFTFADVPAVKLLSYCEGKGSNSLKYTIYLNSTEEGYKVKGKKLFFDYSDVVKSKLSYSKSKLQNKFELSIAFNNYITIDPIIGYSEGNTSTTVSVFAEGFEEAFNWSTYFTKTRYTQYAWEEDAGFTTSAQQSTADAYGSSKSLQIYVSMWSDADSVQDNTIVTQYAVRNFTPVMGPAVFSAFLRYRYSLTSGVPDEQYAINQANCSVNLLIDSTYRNIWNFSIANKKSSSFQSGWIQLSYNISTSLSGIMLSCTAGLVDYNLGASALAELYIDSIEVMKYTSNADYQVWSASNASYRYNVSIPPILSGWQFRRAVTIAGSSAGAVSNYTLNITIHYGSGTSSGRVFFCNNKCKNDFSDIRFVLPNGTLLPAWAEVINIGSNATIWFKVPYIPAFPNTTTIYIYYGNPNAAPNWNGNATFLYFDDFSTDTINRYAQSNGGFYVNTTSGYLMRDSSAVPYCFISANVPFNRSVAVVALAYHNNADTAVGFLQVPHLGGEYDMTGYNANYYITTTYSLLVKHYVGGYSILAGLPALTGVGWYRLEMRVYGPTIRVYRNNTLDASANDTTFSTLYGPAMRQPQTSTIVADWIFVRNYVEPEPSITAWGSEEVNAISENVYVLIPRGHTVVNVTRNDSTLITYTTQQFNNTHIYVVFNASSQYRYTVYTRAWNSIYAMYSEHIYYGYSAPITAVIVLRDPFGNPIQSTQISWWSAYSSSPNFTTFTQVASGVVNTNASGVAIINTTAVNFDSYMLIQAELGGGYAGVSYITLRISAVNITYNIPDIATKNEPMQYNISAKMTLDNTPVARILVNGTAYGGSSITLSYTFNVSGYQQFIAGIAAVNGLAVGYVSVNKTIFVGGSVVWGVSIDPPMLYYIYNQPVTIYADLRYDNGQRPTRPIYLYINDAVITSSLPPLNTTIYISDNMNVILQYIDVDNRVYNYSLAAFMNYLNVNLSVYGTLTNMEFRMNVKVKEGVVGEYNAALYIIKEASENTYEIDRTIYGSNNKLALGGVKIVQKNTSARISALLINYATSARNFTANIKLYVPYVGVISEANTSKTALANNIAYIDVNLSCVLNFNYPVFIEFNIVANDGEYLTYSSLTNIIKPQGFSVIKFTQVSSNRVTLSIDAVNESLYAYVAIVNNIKLSTPNSTIVELSNVRDAIAYVDITFPRRIYESGDVVDIAIDCVSNVKFRGSLKIYVDANLIAAWNVTTNTSLTYRYTIPSGMLSNVLYTHIIKVEFIEEISQSTMASKSQSIYVFNSGPNIQLVSPPEGSTINGTYTIDLAIDDPSKVASVLYRWDFENAWQNVSEPYDIVIDTLKLPNGVARLIVRAYDSKQFMSEKSFYFNIYNQVTEARVFSIWESVGNLIARYAFIPAIAIAAITMLIGFTLGKIMTKKPPQPIIVKLDKEKIERGRKR